MFRRAHVSIAGPTARANAGDTLMSQLVPVTETTAGNVTLTAAEILSGWIQRSGPGAGFTDTWPTADSIISQMPDVQVGDCFQLIYQNTVAFAMTFAAGTGIVSGTGTLNVAASVTRIYYHTVLSNKPQSILVGSNTNASAVLTGFTAAQLATIMPGMGVTGTGIAANSVVLGVTGPTNSGNGADGTVTLNNNCTSTNANIPFTFFPRIRLDAIGTLAA